MNLHTDVKIDKLANATATGTSTIAFTSIDMAEYDNCLILLSLGSFNAGNYVKLGQDTDSALGTIADLAGSKITPIADNGAIVIAVERPTLRYLGLSAVRAGATSTISVVWVIRWNGKAPLPLTNFVSLVTGVFLKDPIAGTA